MRSPMVRSRASRAFHVVMHTVVIAGLAFGMSGCLKKTGEPSTPVTQGVPPTYLPSTTPGPPAMEPLAATGVGPYASGAKLSMLKSTGVLTNVNESTGCPGWATADATAPYAEAVAVVFYNGAINWIEVKNPGVSTMDGAKVGMTLDALKGVYGAKGTELSDGHGGKAFSVHDKGGLGLFFRLSNDGKVSLIEAGKYETLEFRFLEGEGC